ncbi:MAG: hypothetical protein IJY94_01035 [Clostridia bacterium]|nr:hypothetical protein [Clostridia bacterium]
MYTRSYASRNTDTPLPPDYGGTALTLRNPTDEAPTRSALTRPSGRGNAFGRDITPRYPQYNEENYREAGDGIIEKNEPPFGIYGQNGEGEERQNEPVSAPAAITAPHVETVRGDKPLIDLSKLGSDDLLLLGLAFLIFTDKDRDGEIPVDALLILATLFLSGL